MLTWVNAKPEHRAQLSAFRCTNPEQTSFDEATGQELHQSPWEYEVQRHTRSIRPPLHPPQFLLLGMDAGTIVAALELHVAPFDDSCFISMVAVRHDRRGQGYGYEALDRAHNVMAKYGTREFLATARVHRDNDAARRLFRHQGYAHVEDEGEYQTWSALLPTRSS